MAVDVFVLLPARGAVLLDVMFKRGLTMGEPQSSIVHIARNHKWLGEGYKMRKMSNQAWYFMNMMHYMTEMWKLCLKFGATHGAPRLCEENSYTNQATLFAGVS